MVITTSASLHASGTDLARVPPPTASRSAAYSLRSRPITACPALTRFWAIGNPILPSPMKPIVAIASLTFHFLGNSLRLFARCPQCKQEIHAQQRQFDHNNQKACAVDLRKQNLDRHHGYD